VTSDSAFPWNHDRSDGGHYGLARCVACGLQQSNRDPNPCHACSVADWLSLRQSERRTLLTGTSHPERTGTETVAFLDEPDEVGEADFWAEMPDDRYSPLVTKAVGAVKRRWREIRGRWAA